MFMFIFIFMYMNISVYMDIDTDTGRDRDSVRNSDPDLNSVVDSEIDDGRGHRHRLVCIITLFRIFLIQNSSPQ